jgi:TfoX/Sxy family transcriptional regulator of competence genes
MAYDERLAERVRAALDDVPDLAEIKMFGGLCYTVRGNMAVGIMKDELMVRLAAEDNDAALAKPGARQMDFTGRTMPGFLLVGGPGITTERSLQTWVDRGVAYATSLPPKKPKAKKATAKKRAARK